MKNVVTGVLLCLQFFTSIPVKKQLPLTAKSVTAMYASMPLLGLLIGIASICIIQINDYYFHFSTLLLTIFIIIATIMITGGLHVDGLIDTGDAFFSYKDQQKRLEILDDPRVGAFGVLTIICALFLKVGFIYEALSRDVHLLYFIAIPILARLAMLYYFATMKTAKTSGLAAYFKGLVNVKQLIIICTSFLFVLFGVFIYIGQWNIVALVLFMLVIIVLYRHWTMKNFGGMTGDLLGALYEGTEILLWGMLLLFI